MKTWTCAAALLFACASARAAESGSLFLELGGRTSFWDRNHRFSMGGGMGLAYGANESAELELRLDYHFMPPRAEKGPHGAVEIGDGELAAYFAPYRGDFRPMIGGHLGMVRVLDEDLRWSLGMDATALYDIRDRFQLYGTFTPSVLLGDGPGEVWLRAGAGVRVRLGL
ncbi:MAG TPA: hypothetical protein VJ385_14335 [Fibrobacteria bacterium]|nr:hypothetical protein [Fibrobacteria bacterium]